MKCDVKASHYDSSQHILFLYCHSFLTSTFLSSFILSSTSNSLLLSLPLLCSLSSPQVTFMLTDNLRSSRRRRSVGGASAIWPSQGGASNRMAQSDAQLYRDLAQASGGQPISQSIDRVHKAVVPKCFTASYRVLRTYCGPFLQVRPLRSPRRICTGPPASSRTPPLQHRYGNVLAYRL